MTTELARLGIGTVQWGVAYGVNNSIGIAHKDDINMMLAYAAQNSLIIDTAWAYGNSEEKIGSMLDHNVVKIVTKTKPIKTCSSQLSDQAQQVLDAVLGSISLLGGRQLYGVLVHQSDDLLGPHGNRLWRMLKRLKGEGLIEKIGCSFCSPNEYFKVSKRFDLDIVQIPYNIFDQRYINSGMREHTSRYGLEVHLRSIFLQGLFFMKPSELSNKLLPAAPYVKALREKLFEFSLSPQKAALKYVLQTTNNERLIIGSESLEQWNDIVNTIALSPLKAEELEGLSSLAVEEKLIINPVCWIS